MTRWLAAVALAAVLVAGCARVDYPGIGLHEPIVNGGQAEIDAGHVVRVDLPGIWLAGHRTTNGSVFANLVFARVGDVVCVYSRCFHVTGSMVVAHSYRPPPGGLAPLVLQTSWPIDRALLILAS